MTMSQRGDYEETVRRRSGWLIPIAVFVVTAALSALFLLFYLAPGATSFIEEHPAPTSRSDAVSLKVGGMAMSIPANYIIYNSARQGGQQKEVALFATFPDFHGYSDWSSGTFTGNAADSPLVYMLIRVESINLTESDRLQRIYMNYVANPKGAPGPFGLTQYVFRDDSGYRGEDLYVGEHADGPVVLRCVRFSQNVPSPSCMRDVRLKNGVAMTYRFKRAHLADWSAIADGVAELIQSFSTHAK
jgi:hypothetical protein